MAISPGKKTTRRVGAVSAGKTTGKKPAVGKTTTRKAAIVKGPTAKNSPVKGKTTSRAPVVGTGRGRPVGATTAGRTAVSGRPGKGFSFAPIIGLLIGIGLLYGAWRVYDYKVKQDRIAEQQRLAEAEAARLAEEKIKLEKEEAESRRLAAIEAAEQAERDRLEAERIAKIKQQEAERMAREAEEQRLAEEKRKREEDLARNTKNAVDEVTRKGEEALELMKKAEFEKAENLLRPALNSQYLPAEEKEKFKALADNAGLFAMTLSAVKPGPRASANGMYTLTLRDGMVVTGKVTSEALGRLTMMIDGGASTSYDSDKVVKRQKISQEKLDKANMKELLGMRERAQTGIEWYEIAVRALELGKQKIALKCFETGMEKDPKIAFNVRESKALRLFRSGAFDRGMGKNKSAQRKFDELLAKYPGTKAALLAGGEAVEKEEAFVAEIAAAKTGAEATGESAKMHEELAEAKKELSESDKKLNVANTLLSSSEALERKAQSGELSRAEANKCYREAVDKLRKAIVIYQAVNEKNPTPETERKLTRATRKFYWCKKLQTLG